MGHETRLCLNTVLAKQQIFDPLKPRGNMGDSLLPTDRPRVAMVSLPETNQMQRERMELERAVIIDARLRPNHTNSIVQSVLMAACKSKFPFPLTHMLSDQYLLLVPSGSNRLLFLQSYREQIKDMGYVAYPWSAVINAYLLQHKYKVWIELRRMSPQAWNLDHLILTVSSFGVVLDHTPMSNLTSLEKLMVVVVMSDLAKIPHTILLWVKGMSRDVEVLVHLWIEEHIPFQPPLDTTPSQEIFQGVGRRNHMVVMGGEAKQKRYTHGGF